MTNFNINDYSTIVLSKWVTPRIDIIHDQINKIAAYYKIEINSTWTANYSSICIHLPILDDKMRAVILEEMLFVNGLDDKFLRVYKGQPWQPPSFGD